MRWEHYKSRFAAAAPAAPLGRTDRNLTWRAGMTYKPVRRLSLYAGAGTSVNPSIENMTADRRRPRRWSRSSPKRSRTYEVGAKWDGFSGKLLLNAALFRTEKSTPAPPACRASRRPCSRASSASTGSNLARPAD